MEKYQNGKKFVDNREIEARHRLILYGSDGCSIYTATLWADGTTSCNCPAWRFQRKNGRTCKHAKRAACLVASVDETGNTDRSTPAAPAGPSHGTSSFKRRTRSVDT